MTLTQKHVAAALALSPSEARSDFDLNPEVRARQLSIHKRKPAAVLCALRPVGDRLHVVLTERAAHLKQHAGQVAFPGGKIDESDASAQAAALREAEEEIGLQAHQVEIFGALDTYLTSTGYTVTPYVGLIDAAWSPRPDPNEVESVFEPPLDFLMDPANRQRHHHDRNGYRRYFYAMPWNGFYIWGATAGMLKGLSDRIAEVSGAFAR
ncbi:MAG: CoA pyrophosphatase [Pseudomonadota bacterium]